MAPPPEIPPHIPPDEDDDLILEEWMVFHEIDAEPAEDDPKSA